MLRASKRGLLNEEIVYEELTSNVDGNYRRRRCDIGGDIVILSWSPHGWPLLWKDDPVIENLSARLRAGPGCPCRQKQDAKDSGPKPAKLVGCSRYAAANLLPVVESCGAFVTGRILRGEGPA